MSNAAQTFLERTGLRKPKPVDMIGDYTKSYGVKTRFAMLGPVAAGKSTVAAGIVHTCEVRSALVPNFYCRVLPTSTHILADANNLLLGRFPKKTDPLLPKIPEAGFLLCERGWREKKTQVPLCDVAGEITDYIHAKAEGFTPGENIRKRIQGINTQVVQAVRDSHGFMISLAADDALMFREDPDDDKDVYTYTVMNDIFEYRRRNHKNDPFVMVILTKWDKVMVKAKEVDMNAYDETQNGLARFLANGFPATNMLLKPLVDKGLVKFYRSWFQTKKREDGSEIYWNGDPKNPVIDLHEDPQAFVRFRPKYAEADYAEMVKDIGSHGQ